VNKLSKFEALPAGLTMFSMFFGAGNIIFPLSLGQFAGDKNMLAISGLILTAVIMPFAGVFAMILFDGQTRAFFDRLGKIPGLILALAVITLLGPLGSTPRCVALTYTTLKSTIPTLSAVPFCAGACLLLYFLSVHKKRLLSLLGLVLTPLLLTSLGIIILLGFLTASPLQPSDHSELTLFFHGIQEGYNTMDLLAAFFFSSAIISILKERALSKENPKKGYIYRSLQASAIGAFLLTIVYLGFSYIAAFHGESLTGLNKDALLSELVFTLAGPYAGILVTLAIALACLTTAIALITVFSDFVQKEIFHERIQYKTVLKGALLITFLVSTFEFTGISAYLGPVIQICYPGLIVLTFLNIAQRLWGIEMVKIPVFATFILSMMYYAII
jgi:LIVCS family branched-chain amino acid:cation transporter